MGPHVFRRAHELAKHMVRLVIPDHAINDPLGGGVVEVGHLEGEACEKRGTQLQEDAPARDAHHLDMRAEGAQVGDMLGVRGAIAQATKDDLMPTGKAGHQVVSTQLIPLLQWVWHTREQDEQLHTERNRT